MEGENVSRETFSPSVCGEILHSCGRGYEMRSSFIWSEAKRFGELYRQLMRRFRSKFTTFMEGSN
jgi:hypothetical protein